MNYQAFEEEVAFIMWRHMEKEETSDDKLGAMHNMLRFMSERQDELCNALYRLRDAYPKDEMVSEANVLKDEWKREAEAQTLESLPRFMDRLLNGYEHDYGTIVLAMAVCGYSALIACDKEPSAGLTGFQMHAVRESLRILMGGGLP